MSCVVSTIYVLTNLKNPCNLWTKRLFGVDSLNSKEQQKQANYNKMKNEVEEKMWEEMHKKWYYSDTDVQGTVVKILGQGCRIELDNGLQASLNKHDLFWKNEELSNLKEPEIGDRMDVKILSVDVKQQHIRVGAKQRRPNPWTGLSNQMPDGSKLEGTVTKITDYGIFVDLNNGYSGLVQASELDWVNKNLHPSNVASVGDTVTVQVLSCNETKQIISLGIKQCTPNPFETLAQTHTKGDPITCTVSSLTTFGLMVQLACGIETLIFESDLLQEIQIYEKGTTLLGTFLGVDVERERVSLTLKLS